ncbi:DUF1176 domain-containing protein [Brevundimonas sp. S30B]|uniref:DUF1176 domain-containing protein n=1 Tax=unclassified Brevundimonas TaxID=2622653 RepID=UPI001071EC91|nr:MULTISPECIES: DUF1176 domain-containing protein [unclassified Brevundimonas]QBX37263.1 DUF1176 domain-containing protein [Brevundimonas sp. MF30-B]TFW03944.1 DUF1176 domain-containing protein [Brevundimonas sp. S30B]
MSARQAVAAALGLTLLAACSAEEDAPRPAGPNVPGPAAASPSESHTETRKFRGWLAVCDNGRDCFAFAGPVDGDTGWLRIALPAGPDARPAVWAGRAAWDEADQPLVVEVDGRQWPTGAPEPQDGGDIGAQGVVTQDVSGLINALGQSRSIRLLAGGQPVAVLSPSGAAAALLWLDERQGRLGTDTAVFRKGDRPAAAVPAGPALPPAPRPTGLAQPLEARRAPAAAELLLKIVACRADMAERKDLEIPDQGWRLPDGRHLWAIPCFVGAYNVGQSWTITDAAGGQSRLLSLPSSRSALDETVNGEFDPATQTLTAFNKGRGLGDCGILSRWVWTGDAFALESESEMRECWGAPPEAWPTTWRTR